MKELVESIANALVDQPEQVKVRVVENGRQVVYTISAAKNDLGKLIGKSGKNINAFRHLVECIGRKNKKTAMIEIDETSR